MQVVTPEFQIELDKGQIDPRVLVDVVEFYDTDYEPGVDGFDPDDAIERFASVELTWRGHAYRRELRGGEQGSSRSDVLKNMGEKTNSCTLYFSNISRYMATLAQSQTIEGLLCVIRCIAPAVENDSVVLLHGRCGKPSDIDKEAFTLEVRQDFGNINTTMPPRSFTAQDPEGRLPSDPLFEGINFIAQIGSVSYPVVVPSTSFFGRLFGRRQTVYHTQQSSSMDGTPYGEALPEVFGRCQMALIPFLWKDQGLHIAFLMAICNGPIDAATNLKVRTPGWSVLFNSFAVPPAPPRVHLGLTGTANEAPTNFPQAGYFSNLAYLDANSSGSTFEQIDTPPEVTAIVRGKIIPVPDENAEYTLNEWTDNPVHIARFLLTDPKFVNINPAFMEDAINVLTAEHCNVPLIDESTDQVIRVISIDLNEVSRHQSTGIYSPAYVSYYELGTSSDAPELEEYPTDDIIPVDPDYDNPFTPVYQKILRKRYTFNAPITSEVRAVDYLYKTVFPTFKGFIRVNKRGKYEIRSEQPSDQTFLRSATSIGATTLPVQDVTPWKTGPDLLQGSLLIGFNITTSEVRTVSSAAYSADGNGITLAVSKTGSVTIVASGGTLTGGSASVQASGTITVGGTAAEGNTITATINGWPVEYIITENETTETAARMLSYYINATPRIAKYLKAEWVSTSPTIITLKALYGVLTLDSQLLKAHTGPVPDPASAPTLTASGSGTLGAGTYKVAYADVSSLGQTAITPTASVGLSANQKIDISSLPAFPAGITSRNFYVSEEANSSNLRFVVNRTNVSDFSINSLPEPGASLPPTHNRTAEELIRVAMPFSTNSQDIFPAWSPNTLVPLNDIYLPTSANGHKYQVTTQGTTHVTTEPTWPTFPGGTVVNGSATFTEIGATYLGQSGLTRANIKKKGIKWPQGSRQSSVNQVKISYRSARDDFALVPYRVNDPVHQAQVKKIYPMEVDGSAIDSFHQMYRIANWALAKHREGDWFFSIDTGPGALLLEEGDVICASDDSGGLVNIAARIEELRIHANHDVTIHQARKYSTNMFSDDVGADTIPIASTLRPAGLLSSHIEFIDTAPIRESDSVTPGFYVVVSRPLIASGDWRGWTLWVDFGDGYTTLVKGDLAGTIGTATTTLGNVTDPDLYDTVNTLTFTVQYGTRPLGFTNATQAELIANPLRNLFFIGGREYIQAATITDNGSDSYTLSNLYRGRFHTFMKTGHRPSEKVIYMNGSEVFIPMNGNRRLFTYNYKAVTTNQDLDDATAVSFTWSGGTYRPEAPRDITVYRDAYEDPSNSAGQVQLSIPYKKTIYNEPRSYAVDVYSSTPDGTFTVDAGTNVFTATSHGLTADDTIALSTTNALPYPLQKEDHYFLRDITTHTFKLARLEDGSAIDIIDIGTGTHSFTKRLRHITVAQEAVNPVVINDFVNTVTVSGGKDWKETKYSAYAWRNDFGNAASAAANLRVFGNVTGTGWYAEFSIASIGYEPGTVIAVNLSSTKFDPPTAEVYHQMLFTLETSLPAPFDATARRWRLSIKEGRNGLLSTYYTDTDYEMPETRYRIEIEGSHVSYYRNHAGAGSVPIYTSKFPVILPVALDAEPTTEGFFLNVMVGGRPEYVATYTSDQMIEDTSTTPPPTTFRYRAYEVRTFQNVDYESDAADFIT